MSFVDIRGLLACDVFSSPRCSHLTLFSELNFQDHNDLAKNLKKERRTAGLSSVRSYKLLKKICGHCYAQLDAEHSITTEPQRGLMKLTDRVFA